MPINIWKSTVATDGKHDRPYTISAISKHTCFQSAKININYDFDMVLIGE